MVGVPDGGTNPSLHFHVARRLNNTVQTLKLSVWIIWIISRRWILCQVELERHPVDISKGEFQISKISSSELVQVWSRPGIGRTETGTNASEAQKSQKAAANGNPTSPVEVIPADRQVTGLLGLSRPTNPPIMQGPTVITPLLWHQPTVVVDQGQNPPIWIHGALRIDSPSSSERLDAFCIFFTTPKILVAVERPMNCLSN